MIETWSNMWRVKLNPQKTQCVLFTRSTSKKKQETHRSQTLRWNNKSRKISKTGQPNPYSEHRETGTKKTKPPKNAVRKKIWSLTVMSVQTVLKVYISYIQSLFGYALPAWITASPQQMNRLQIIQNMAIKMAYRQPRYISNHHIHSISGLTSINNIQSSIGQKFIDRAIHNLSLKEALGEAKWTTNTCP